MSYLCLGLGLWGLHAGFGLRLARFACGSADLTSFCKVHRFGGIMGLELLSCPNSWRFCGALGFFLQSLDQGSVVSFVPQLESVLDGTVELP